MATLIQVDSAAGDGRYLTLDELAAFVDQARQAGVDGTSRLAVRTKAGWSGPFLRTIRTAKAEH